ncbi:hypothetical protein AMTR_s00006p00268470 [Amborella trichopoda]|uniref:Uncharacterized protein n=1 Tax=Amborella trichopoda TaxID=13333 RepID=W1PE60_AMBTC|nr:hypothetical protein AMTR_s00006p00268470 [Amborella trichopoda]
MLGQNSGKSTSLIQDEFQSLTQDEFQSLTLDEFQNTCVCGDYVCQLSKPIGIYCSCVAQIVTWFIIPAVRNSGADHTNNTLALIVLIQYVPRLFLIFPLNARIVKTTGVVTKTAWAGAAYNLLLYMLASHVLGASWYLLSIGRMHTCWKMECRKENGTIIHMPKCDFNFLDCGSSNYMERQSWLNKTHVISNCDPANSVGTFNFGIYADALINEVVQSKFLEKYLYCLWWGLKNLSSYGQNLTTRCGGTRGRLARLVEGALGVLLGQGIV